MTASKSKKINTSLIIESKSTTKENHTNNQKRKTISNIDISKETVKINKNKRNSITSTNSIKKRKLDLENNSLNKKKIKTTRKIANNSKFDVFEFDEEETDDDIMVYEGKKRHKINKYNQEEDNNAKFDKLLDLNVNLKSDYVLNKIENKILDDGDENEEVISRKSNLNNSKNSSDKSRRSINSLINGKNNHRTGYNSPSSAASSTKSSSKSSTTSSTDDDNSMERFNDQYISVCNL
jgi:hypothetical protein